MKAYKIKPKKGKTFWTTQLLVEEQTGEEVIGEATIDEDFVSELSEEDKNYMILEMAQTIRLDNVAEKLEEEKKKKPGKARKTFL